jgi:hypothetical protein
MRIKEVEQVKEDVEREITDKMGRRENLIYWE